MRVETYGAHLQSLVMLALNKQREICPPTPFAELMFREQRLAVPTVSCTMLLWQQRYLCLERSSYPAHNYFFVALQQEARVLASFGSLGSGCNGVEG